MMQTRRVTLILSSGGSVVLTNPFNCGTGIAGDIAGQTRYFGEDQIEKVIEHKA